MSEQLLNRLELTPGLRRAILRAAAVGGEETLSTPAMLAGLLLEDESRAAAMLAKTGVSLDAVKKRWPGVILDESAAAASLSTDATMPPIVQELETVFKTAVHWSSNHHLPTELATEHVLLGLLCEEATTDVGVWLRERGLRADQVGNEILSLFGVSVSEEESPIDWDWDEEEAGENLAPSATSPATPRPAIESLDLPDDTDAVGLDQPGLPDTVFEVVPVLRAFDASANRAREAIRVVEDYVRFVLDDRYLTERLKRLRHEMTTAIGSVPITARLIARDTQSDVGTQISTPTERERENLRSLVAANFSRLQEALRSMEEFGKLLDPTVAARLEQVRYMSYILHSAVENTRASVDRLLDSRLYVLVDGGTSPEAFEKLVTDLTIAGVDLIQLRDKRLGDRELLDRARMLRRLTEGTGTLFIMNDRPDLARLADADGVHLGQEELTVKDARRIVGQENLIGVSTHTIEQARAAVLDGANYIGVGPTFPSGTKQFDTYPGLDLLKAVAAEIRLPSFAIGGITVTNLSEILATGIRRIAVSGSILTSKSPSQAAALLAGMLQKF